MLENRHTNRRSRIRNLMLAFTACAVITTACASESIEVPEAPAVAETTTTTLISTTSTVEIRPRGTEQSELPELDALSEDGSDIAELAEPATPIDFDEAIEPAECPDGTHRHTDEGECHIDDEILSQDLPPLECENNARGGECTIADGADYIRTDEGWVHDDIETTPEPVLETPLIDAGCSDLVDAGAFRLTDTNKYITVDLSEPGRWRWAVCIESAEPVIGVSVQGNSNIPGVDLPVYFPGLDADCHAEQTHTDPPRFSLAFSVTDDPYNPDREPEPCLNPIVDDSRGAWAGNYNIRVLVDASDYEAYFLVERLGG